MNTLTLEGWCKAEGSGQACPIEQIHFRVDEDCRLLLEKAEEELQESTQSETFVPIDMTTMELATSNDCGELKDCKIRVYLRNNDQRGQFHLVANRVSDDCLVYTNAVMIDQLG
ncbi:hypothetical protein EOPP23_13625 [Endozoicomonas sp. OPT23]|uniref:hypothetical protein n=1 Tax=Endozoicomonas sp. OPT23 TaxID=2072845 RepID=UPI00129C099B|nr:hypothetical protein [Endozoicomonas sp. OPT23]MRI34031.1 hypothetical protein [Endozoicomonas sp. OPT23]